MTGGATKSEVHVPIASSDDVVVARQKGRALAVEIGFTASESTESFALDEVIVRERSGDTMMPSRASRIAGAIT